ncbi:MAG TPA: 2Fe-2S iron-sulfur cluster-binding protein [Burkholderiaceae bacterium]|nr:2Fe-2S iron-sulfur cluster-binding protein [Burkholderiaceae bacterium]HMX10067.1 2Fe-2S iron-sulfur cluster-binding protein [Burkholderiaceae bacterium]HNB44128.1 2Fe-2S iron-sulfur cluster-binding protein [Burkholderiaceae bacterium]HNG80160.1 2Fe-2S iron-sulfur cluster-binding protein [Burkholderiaceae bacterium]
MHRLRIEPAGWDLPAPPGATLLQAARAAGIDLPRSCQNGSCRACRCRLLAGEVDYRVPWPGLSAEERAAGEVLPCVAEPRSDVTLAVPQARLRPLATGPAAVN